MQSETDSQKVIRMLKNVAPKHCDICGNKYEESDFNLVKNQGNQVVIHLHCTNCGNTYMLNIFNPAQGLVGSTRSPLNLDLAEAGEVMNFAGSKPISINEALDAYHFFAKGAGTEIIFAAADKFLEQEFSSELED